MRIRDIQSEDNAEIARIIKRILEDFGVPKIGSAYADESLNNMVEAYDIDNAHYFVVLIEGKLVGGAGIAQLDNYHGKVCELQKMYLLPEARGKGIGRELIKVCIEKAKQFGYEQCYLETMPNMKIAQKLYQNNGFRYLDATLGDTGHSACPVWMLRDI